MTPLLRSSGLPVADIAPGRGVVRLEGVAALERVDVADLRPVPVALAAAVPTLPGRGAWQRQLWSGEPKYDGFRGVVLRWRDATGERCVVQSRRGTDLTGAFPDVAAAALEQLPPGYVLDGELVVGAEGRLDFGALQRRLAGRGRAGARVRRLAAAQPATFLAFDVLVEDGVDVRPLPLGERRLRLGEVMAGCRPPLQQVPWTLDRDLAERWLADYAAAHVGVEGLVLKRVNQPYRAAPLGGRGGSGSRSVRAGGGSGWSKLRWRDTAEALVGAVTGSLARPDRLILALPDGAGGLRVAGGTSSLPPAQARQVAALLSPPRAAHPWPGVLPAGRTGAWGARPLEVTLVEPTLVVEVLADTASGCGRWRHVVRFVRARPDLTGAELDPASLNGADGRHGLGRVM